MINSFKEHRKYHQLPGNRKLIAEFVKNKEKYIERPDIFIADTRRLKLNFGVLPQNLIQTIFDRNASDISKEYYTQDIHASDWLFLSSLCIGLKRFFLANEFRNFALRRTLQYKSSIGGLFFCDQIIGASIELEKFEGLKKYLNVSRVLGTQCGKSLFKEKFYRYLTNRPQSIKEGIEESYSIFIKEKSIGIVGPLKLSDAEVEELKQKDVIVKMNDFSLFSGNKLSEIIPNIIFYTGLWQKPFSDKKNKDDFQYLPEFIVFKKKKYFSPFLKNQIRIRDNINPFTFSGALNMVPRIILDLLLYKAHDIKVYGTDLYTSLDFSKNYDGLQQDNWEVVLEHFINHDLITNYKFMHSLWKKGLYKADNRLEGVMNLGLKEYLKYFEKKASDNG